MSSVVDTSWIYALLNGNDPHHAKAKRDARTADRLVVPPAVLVETLGLVALRRGLPEARSALGALQGLLTVSLGQPDHDHEATVRVWDAHPHLSYVDAAAIAAARRLGVGIRTYDTKQKKAHTSGRP